MSKNKIKDIFLKLFLVFELTISFIFLIQYVSMTIKQSELEEAVKSIFKTENLMTLNITPGPMRKKELDVKELDNFYKDLLNDKDIKVSSFNAGDITFTEDSKKIDFIYDNYDKKKFDIDQVSSSNSLSAPVLRVDKNASYIYDFKLSEGSKIDFDSISKNQDVLPVLAGVAYKEHYKLNDLIKTTERTYKIVGFLEQGQFFTTDTRSLFYDYIFLDNAIVSPENNYNATEDLGVKMGYFNDLIIKYSNGSDKDKVINDIQGYIDRNNIECTISEYSQIKQTYLSSLRIPRPYELFIFVGIIISSILGIGIMLILRVIYRKNEIGIKLAFGYSKLRIFSSLFIDSGVIILISFLLSIGYYKFFNIKDLFVVRLGAENCLIIFCIALLISVITSIIPAVMLMKSTPKDLIGGIR